MFLILSAFIFNFQIFVWVFSNVILCEHHSGYISCTYPSRIYVSEAIYGRTAHGSICPHSSIRTTHCRSSTSDRKVKALCNGKSQCLRFLINTLVSSNCSFTSITINRTNGMQFHGPSTETTTDIHIWLKLCTHNICFL
jgi:hypothetical protein